MSFKGGLFEFLFNLYSIEDKDEFLNNYYTRESKEKPCSLLRIGNTLYSPRQALIHISENVVKPILGESFFGEYVKSKMTNINENYVFSDCGFENEIKPLLSDCNRVRVARVYRDGCSFNGDSRKYLTEGILISEQIKDFNNNTTVEDICNKLYNWFTKE